MSNRLPGRVSRELVPRRPTGGQQARLSASDLALAAYAPLLAEMGEAPTIDVFRDPGYLEHLPDFKGRDCAAGSRFVAIHGNGDVVRCGDPPVPLGNLLDGTLRLWSEARPCDTSYCIYFCNKYAASAAQPGRFAGAFQRLIHRA